MADKAPPITQAPIPRVKEVQRPEVLIGGDDILKADQTEVLVEAINYYLTELLKGDIESRIDLSLTNVNKIKALGFIDGLLRPR